MSAPAAWSRGRVAALTAGRSSGGARSARPASRVARLSSPALLFAFVGTEFLCQILLLFSAFAGQRVVMRTAAFAGSFGLHFLLGKPGRSHPAWPLAALVTLIGCLSIFHPDTNGIWAGVAAVGLQLAILSPIFWVPRLRIDLITVRRLFLAFWAINAVSAVLGALQVYFPGRFEPATASVLEGRLDALTFNLADGTAVLRPMGLTDTPGGAASGAFYCVLLGVGILMDRPRPWFRPVLLGSMGLALVTLYLCQVRALALMLGLSVLALGVPLAAQRRVGRYAIIVGTVALLATIGFLAAVALGGEAVSDRFSSLIANDPGSVYYNNRGHFIQTTLVDLLPQYPLGAGLGRWGMIASYFADPLQSAKLLWAEVQWTAWLYDGGVPLMLAYGLALLAALFVSLRIARRAGAPDSELRRWATVLFAYNIGAIALTFNACPFSSTLGIDFWLLNATVFAASSQAA